MVRTIIQWMKILEDIEATPSGAKEIARRVLGDIGGYPSKATRNYNAWIDEDVVQLANVLMAYANLMVYKSQVE